MTIGTASTRVGQATEPGALLNDAALTQQADRHDEEPTRERRGRFAGKLWLHVTLTVVATLLSIPFVYLILMSLKPYGEIGNPSWIPQNPQFVQIGPQQPAGDVDVIGSTPPVELEPEGEVPALEAAPAVAEVTLPPALAEDAEVVDAEAVVVERVRYLPVDWLPFNIPIPANYFNVFDTQNPDINNRGVPLHLYFRNSFFVASWVTFLQVVTSSMAAFSFARLKWTGRDKVFLLYLSTMMLPGLVMMIPNYQIMIQLGLVDTLPGLIIPAAFSAFGTFLLRQFMLTIPSSLDEAAEIDGAGKFRLFWDIILPLSRPGLVTLTIFTFMGNYNSFFWPLVMLRTQEKYTLPIGLLFFNSSRGQQTHLMMAAVMLSIIPMILIFVLLQKQLVKGIQLGAVKG
jgi:ABC-type glycerol-3-phosphate transport system permease component